ncbi:hypothetical protein FHS83_001431 [Rhizomicrobium palustre]|uniref:NTF2 fold domain-containing protein n=1 Tax=Rhizomicrobium palustre TaxID=189966 RepID=A0A846MXU1_9PROT|nr:hypothetical protein [Rhizomicrobium palustre]NIK88113.1 hypothetical protein [Rhizomicrobium palustre]
MRYLLIALAFAFTSPSFAFNEKDYPPPPSQGYVPDASTAIAIARSVLVPIYGDTVPKDAAFEAKREGDVWHVTRMRKCPPTGLCGGAVESVFLSTKDGRILAAFRVD